ncbi:multiple monosaccharide ABC transporter permease [Marinactinospora thermotolerans]|uniref:Xylose transport system permease protein XylH n=1 Tax=Marinactinospora thermotolerans DSM 45154 TaxID=1122192 RepID=A0A1T4LRI6_9ACTN|nr:multiple monosaccharide ABC transporter permease [Marinactinospora thermotolerans]SJZ57350.1 multiple monosaccharide ABC transporter membrane protein [Marinactinospora thermotolerans DSM 45154]
MSALRELQRGNVRQYGMLMALVAIVVLFSVLTGGLLLRPINITNLIMQNSYVLILAIGMMLVIVTGHIDLSVGSVVAFVGAVSAVMLTSWDLPVPLVIVLALGMGALVGAWQGFWIAYVRIPAFIVTLAGMLVFRGATMIVLGGESIGPLPDSLRALGSGYLPDVFGGQIHVLTLVLGALACAALVWSRLRARARSRRHGLQVGSAALFWARTIALVVVVMAFAYVLAIENGVPVVGVLLVALIVVFSFVMNSTTVGRHVYAVGGNEKAAMLSGVKTQRTTFWVFVTMGTLSALAGLVFMARLNAATPRAGTMFELDAIAAAFIGGASASGGVGTVVGAVVGALVMGVMNNGMSLIGLGADWQQAIKGLVLLAAVAFDIYNKNRVGRSVMDRVSARGVGGEPPQDRSARGVRARTPTGGG